MAGRRVVVAAVTVGLVVGGGVATAAVKAPVAVKACVDSSGYLSVASKHACAKGSKLTSLLVKGAKGLTGAAGPAGARGATGAAGANGSNGVNGTNGTNGVDGLSAVYSSYTPTLYVPINETTSFATAVTVTPGQYIVHWEGWLENYGTTDSDIVCGLASSSTQSGLNFAGSGRGAQQPGSHDNAIGVGASFPLRATTNLTLEIYCQNANPGDFNNGGASTQKLIGALLTFTATSHLYDQTGTVYYP